MEEYVVISLEKYKDYLRLKEKELNLQQHLKAEKIPFISFGEWVTLWNRFLGGARSQIEYYTENEAIEQLTAQCQRLLEKLSKARIREWEMENMSWWELIKWKIRW